MKPRPVNTSIGRSRTIAVGFPPTPVYPFAIDTDYTLYLVYNTTEAPLATDNQPWAEEVQIVPVAADKPEIWASNGFANLDGELFYYDSVELDGNGKVYKLKRCARNIGGRKTHYNRAGVFCRGFVIAEHHNQLVDAILRIENFVGENFSADITTLDWRIRNLQATPVIFDDFSCPDLDFTFNIVSSDPASGVTATYNVSIQGTYTNYILDFGDGTSTQSSLSGTHVYAPNATIDPIITLSNDNCQIVQSPITRSNPEEPTPVTLTPPLQIPVPEIPPFPPVSLAPLVIPDVKVNAPIIVPPCLDIGPLGPIVIPSVIMIEPPINIPSIILFSPIPSFSPIEIIGPSYTPIEITGPSYSPIEIIGPSFSPIEIIGPSYNPISITGPSYSPIEIIGPSFSPISIVPPNLPSMISIVGCKLPSIISFAPISIPSMISITPPTMPSIISITPPNIPSMISVVGCKLPSVISITPPSIPSIISITPPNIPSTISITPPNIPSTISIIPPTCPSVISVQGCKLPSVISWAPITIPSIISIVPPTIPSIISIIPPTIPSIISIQGCAMPSIISITGGSIPSVISIQGCNLASVISFAPVSFATVSFAPVSFPTASFAPVTFPQVSFAPVSIAAVAFSPVTLGPVSFAPVTFPQASFAPVTFPTVSFAPVTFPTVSFAPVTLGPVNFSPLAIPPISFTAPPSISVVWGTPPTVSCVVTVNCPASTPMAMAASTMGMASDRFAYDPARDGIEVEVGNLGIPSEIKIIAPTLPDVKLVHTLPVAIDLRVPMIPDIKIVAPDTPLPTEIKVVNVGVPHHIEVRGIDLPKYIPLVATGIPTSISLTVPDDFPRTILVDASGIPSEIQVVGIPSAIELIAPSAIQLQWPDEVPEIPLVYRGSPIDVRIQMDVQKLTGGDDPNGPACVMIVPCPR